VACDCHTTEGPLNELVQTIATMGNRRKDKFIFIGISQEDCLQGILKNKFVSGLRKKYGYDTSTGNLGIEPLSFDPSGSMVKLRDPSQWKPNSIICDKFNGVHLRISGPILPHWVYRLSSDGSLPVHEQFDGTPFRIFWEASKRLDFTSELYVPPDQSYDQLLPNGTWIGQVGDVVKKENPYDAGMILGLYSAWYPILDFSGYLGFARLEFLTSHSQRFTD